jgi:uncharacterized protein DUF2721
LVTHRQQFAKKGDPIANKAVMLSPNEHPFSVLTAVVAPAILTNASSVLCLGTSNRIARVVDRTREVTAEIANLETG